MIDDIFINRLKDLANTTYIRNIPTFTNFLDLNGQTVYYEFILNKNMPPVNCTLNGGLILKDDILERRIACFYPKNYDEDMLNFPVSIIKVKPLNSKFADSLSHRDFLGAILNLGLERDVIGDILIMDNLAYLLIMDNMADYIINNLTRIKHTSVMCTICNETLIDYTPKFAEVKGSVASERLDGIIAFVYNLSRTTASEYISARKVFINGKLTLSKSQQLKYGDIVSVRGLGRFIFDEVVNTTKKGRFFIKARKYM